MKKTTVYVLYCVVSHLSLPVGYSGGGFLFATLFLSRRLFFTKVVGVSFLFSDGDLGGVLAVIFACNVLIILITIILDVLTAGGGRFFWKRSIKLRDLLWGEKPVRREREKRYRRRFRLLFIF